MIYRAMGSLCFVYDDVVTKSHTNFLDNHVNSYLTVASDNGARLGVARRALGTPHSVPGIFSGLPFLGEAQEGPIIQNFNRKK